MTKKLLSIIEPRRFRLRTPWFSINAIGIEFPYKRDYVLWIWPWKRYRKNFGFFSMGFNDAFESLRDLDDEWIGYWKAMQGDVNDG